MTFDRPSQHGLALGKMLARWAREGKRPEDGDPCMGCAYREGAMANAMAATGKHAMNCAAGVDPAPFGCHKGMVDGRPTRACAGWLAARRYATENFEAVKTDLRELAEVVGACDPDFDPMRAEFEVWAASVDPSRQLNDYALAALWDRREATPCSPSS